jgi:hypothetical protein
LSGRARVHCARPAKHMCMSSLSGHHLGSGFRTHPHSPSDFVAEMLDGPFGLGRRRFCWFPQGPSPRDPRSEAVSGGPAERPPGPPVRPSPPVMSRARPPVFVIRALSSGDPFLLRPAVTDVTVKSAGLPLPDPTRGRCGHRPGWPARRRGLRAAYFGPDGAVLLTFRRVGRDFDRG